LFISLTVVIFTANIALIQPMEIDAYPTHFTIEALVHGSSDYYNYFKQHLARIGIQMTLNVVDWPTYIGELIFHRNFDVTYLGLSGGGLDPDMTGVYNENGSLNLFGYDTSMDWDEDLGTGKNEWYIREGTRIIPPNSQERIQHYYAWQNYFMDNICPQLPGFSPRAYGAQWSNLFGYNYTKGILQSWGKMSWLGSHTGQINTSEIVITDAAWENLNPLTQSSSSSSFISSACMDPLIWYDADLSSWPHLAKSIAHVNDTHVRIKIREGIKWDADFDGNFTNEYLDVEDVYFTLFCLSKFEEHSGMYFWLEDMEIVDQYTLDIFIDNDPGTEENEPDARYLSGLTAPILPEHYLNQSQLADGVTPDVNHTAWEVFSNHCFGTGLFEINQYLEGIETVLTVNPDCWKLNATLTSDPELDWFRRFGDFSSGLNQIRIRIIPDVQTSLIEFEAGRVDLESISWNPDKRNDYMADIRFNVQSRPQFSFAFLAYNMRENRQHIGNRDPCPNAPSITIGLAVRKAISYAIDLEEINNNLHGGDHIISYTPLYPALGVWNNPNIIRYDHNLELAEYYLYLAGYLEGFTPSNATTPGLSNFAKSMITASAILVVAATTTFCAVFVFRNLAKKRK
jgi:ABC-type transport system substrate-binding protein